MKADIVILAGGNSSRMNSNIPKFLLEIANKPMIEHIMEKYKILGFTNIHVVIPPKYSSEKTLYSVNTVVQQVADGNANALLLTLSHLKSEYTIVQYADMPLITSEEISNLYYNKGTDLVFVVGVLPNDLLSKPYGRVFLDDNNNFCKLIEYRDLTIEQRNQRLFNAGFYMFKTDILKRYLNEVPYHPGLKERYITDIIEILKNDNKKIKVIITNNYTNFLGVNTQEELEIVNSIMMNRLSNSKDKYYESI